MYGTRSHSIVYNSIVVVSTRPWPTGDHARKELGEGWLCGSPGGKSRAMSDMIGVLTWPE